MAVVYRSDAAAAEATVRALPGSGHAVFGCDVADPSAIEALVAAVAVAAVGAAIVLGP